MKPNFIIVMTDQQRADLRKSNGCPIDTMPFLDEWSADGVDFTKAYSPNPICLAARISMFTGRYSQTHRARTNNNEEDAYYTEDLLEVLKNNGYATALCGKNHTHHDVSDFDFFETNDHFMLGKNQNITDKDIEFNHFLETQAPVCGNVPSPHGIEVQFPYKNVNSALKFFDSLEDNQSFFTWISFAEPHGPYQVPEPYFDMFPIESLPTCISSDEAVEKNKGYRYMKNRKGFETFIDGDLDETILRCRSNYFGMLRLIDDQFKRLIQGLKDRNLEDNTVIVYLSDHGEAMGEYGLIRKALDLNNLVSNIPMIWKGAGIEKIGKEDKSFVNLVDVFPTICDMADITTPDGVQGKSILPLLKNDSSYDIEFDCAYMESGYSGLYITDEDSVTYSSDKATAAKARYNCLNSWTQSGQVRALRYKDYKLQIDMMGTGYLYDLSKDKFEMDNLWENDCYKDIKITMLEKLIMMSLQNCDVLPHPRNRMTTKVHPKGYWYQNYNI